jgi:hypothetical protein
MNARINKAGCAVIKHWGAIVSFCMIAVLIGVGGQLVLGRTQPTPYWIIFGGNLDPNDDDGVGAREDLIAGGWTTQENSVQVHWVAAIEQGTARITDEAMAEGHAEFARHCKTKGSCIVAGFSLGNSPALQLAAEEGIPPENTYLFGSPQAGPGVFHNPYLDNPIVEPYFVTFSALFTDRPVAAGVQNHFDARGPYENAGPQCAGPGLFALTLAGHRVITREEANASRVWTSPDGVVNHEVTAGPPIVSGADPSPIWAGCPPGGWYSPTNTRANPGPAPGAPGVPDTSAPSAGEVTSEVPVPALPGG